MRTGSLTLLVVASLSLSACMTQAPMTAAEFRKAVGEDGHWSVKTETMVVNRPYRAVTKSFQKHAQKCLSVSIRTVEHGARHHASYVTTYRPTMRVNGRHAELHVQQHIDGTIKVADEPPGGYFLIVVDILPAGKNKTRLNFFRPAMGHGTMINGIKAWAKGRNGCPDLTKRSGLL